MTLWVTFVPCFLWIFAGAPYVEALLDRPRLKGALTAISAVVVGVILNLSVWFTLHVAFTEVIDTAFGPRPVWSSLDHFSVGLVLLATFLLMALQWPVLRLLLALGVLAGGVHLIT